MPIAVRGSPLILQRLTWQLMISRYFKRRWYVIDQLGFLVVADVTYIKAQWVALCYRNDAWVGCDDF
jgi:hypothetical protein